jgi:hypothetical protein
MEVFTLPHQFLVESSGILRIPRNPRNEPEFENLRIFIKFSCIIPGSFLVHSHSIPGLLYQHQEWPGIFLRNPSGQTGSFPVIPYYYYISWKNKVHEQELNQGPPGGLLVTSQQLKPLDHTVLAMTCSTLLHIPLAHVQ